MAVKIEMLRCFCTVAQTGSLVEAADRLGRTQSAVSMTLKQLEDHLGKRLFEGERKNRLSPLGEQVFELALKQVRQFDQAVQSIEAAANAVQGLIRIVSVPSVAALLFPLVLEHMTRKFPGLKVELRDTDTQQVLDAMTQGKADIGIASGYHPLNGIKAVPLFEDQFGLVSAADHPLMLKAEPLTIADVVAAPFVANALCELIRTPRFLTAVANTDVTIHNTHSLITMVRTGAWVTVLPQTVARFIPESTAFREISDLPDKREVFLYIRERSRFRELTEECSNFILRTELL
ncbi:MAG: LysR family transcriptional regulator [Roseibium album]|uniref:CysJI operon transcriptional activator n=1 Tax=Roseibium album TaxID=311410 RepID=A0A0M7A6X9_9HYPH|nr:LysR family transcriptional regulator [Roseibium album]MBG6144256.1 DNA-binding transcriptional LysR family regulator [Labrenzia sp. EL_142]MBG6157267.1 DNA-binding transcriptional LysR family regulator [Labrenzia sp. EL_162]MBG6162628.1 DNA-binding transcriptional LysR family regulator [Labrenzia sp. EL_195]MBG6177818.1 DNA-binding transcriptional LysR family regulator [Labrenzia sp. EL_132]MBG6196339.1 DNA-binding transcriptional LysR family regulator [Labrenzia sp. EL_159]MBG6201766.1 D